jgi:hypothetical protein
MERDGSQDARVPELSTVLGWDMARQTCLSS